MTIRTALPTVALLALFFTQIVPAPRLFAANADKPQYYELRVYTTKSEDQQQRLTAYWQSAAIPAYNRLGSRPIGVFTENKETATNQIFVFIPYDSAEAFAALPAKLGADAAYQQAAAEYWNAPKTNAAYESLRSSLLVAFDGMKQLVVPPPEPRPNVFELRTYISPSEGKGWNKIQMFESGEITLMKEVGLAPIFYGRTVAGAPMPSLVYLTCAEDLAAHKKHWQSFGNGPVWKKLSADPQYRDNMNGLQSLMLKRTAASQL